jgi:predicted AAA+ superfamily ATPase
MAKDWLQKWYARRVVLSVVVARRLEAVVLDALQVEPVVVLHGPRAVGKSTLLARLAARFGREVIDLDDPVTRDAVAAGPSFAVGGDAPVFLDEYQHVPAVLDSIKAELNRDARPGRFVLTGSTSWTTLPRAAQSLTGRARVFTVPPLSQWELADPRGSATTSFVDRLLDAPAAACLGPPATSDRLDYAARMLDGGFPMALRRTPQTRSAWFDSYVDLVMQRDVRDIRRVRQREVLPRLLRRLVAQTGQLINVAHAARSEGLDPSVAGDYTALLEAVFLVHRLPAWGTTLGSRINAQAKLHVLDTGIGGWLLDLSVDALARRSPSALTESGHLLESFVVNEILAQTGWRPDPVQVGHHRTRDGHEIDIVLQLPGGDVVAIEVKAGERTGAGDIGPLTRLRERLGDRFRGGVLLHTGPHTVELGERIVAAPIERLWAGAAGQGGDV